MKIVIRDCRNKLYLAKKLRGWTGAVSRAVDFQTTAQAKDFIRRRRIRNVEILLKSLYSDAEVVASPCPNSSN